jgi:hypothetical protein
MFDQFRRRAEQLANSKTSRNATVVSVVTRWVVAPAGEYVNF